MTLIRTKKLAESGFLPDDIVVAPPLGARFALCVVAFCFLISAKIRIYFPFYLSFISPLLGQGYSNCPEFCCVRSSRVNTSNA
jgi:hypothetical protein